METRTGKIGLREFIAIALFMMGMKITDDTPAVLFKPMLNAAWMTPIINAVIALVPIVLLIKVITAYNGESLMSIIIRLFGKYFGTIVLFYLWLISCAAIIVDTAIYTDIIRTMYFVKTPTVVIYVLTMAICVYGAKKGLEAIGSTSWAILPYITVSLAIVIIITLMNGQTDFLFPFFGPGEWVVIKESALKLSIYADFLYLFLLVPYISSFKDFKKGTWIALLILIIQLTLAIASYIMLFDYMSVKLLNYPFHEALRYIEIGQANVESIFLPFWLIASFIRFAIYLYISGMLFGRIFKIERFDYVLPSLGALFLLIGMIPETPTFTIFKVREIVLNVASPSFFLLPVLLWIIAKIKGDFKHEKT